MPNSNFIFGCILGYRILKQSDNLRYEFKVFQYLVVRVKVFWKISSEHFQKTFNLTIYNLFWDFMLLHRKIGENNQQLKRVGKLSDWLKYSKKNVLLLKNLLCNHQSCCQQHSRKICST